jgi:hypothetical protein
MISSTRRTFVAAVWCLLLASACRANRPPPDWLNHPQHLAAGVDYFHTTDTSLVDDAGPIAVFLLRLDPARIRLTSVLSNDEVANAETVQSIAVRHKALAAINGGFFNNTNGEPTGVLKVSGELVSDASVLKGAVVVESRPGAVTSLTFDRLAAKRTLTLVRGDEEWRLPVDGIDTTRERGKLMLYTPAYHADTDTAPTGTEWVVDGDPLIVRAVRPKAGRTPIPRTGLVLSYGGLELPAPLQALTVGTRVTVDTQWRSSRGLPARVLDGADHVINGAGLLRWQGQPITEWTLEGLTPEVFTNVRHPRTVIGVDAQGTIWLAAVDGRQSDYSIGMRFDDLQRLADRLGLTDALNLDGGGSTTMVIQGQIVNRPSDATGPRPVGDAILVTTQ